MVVNASIVQTGLDVGSTVSLVCITGHHLPDGSEAMISECVKTYGGMKEWSPTLQSCAGIISSNVVPYKNECV